MSNVTETPNSHEVAAREHLAQIRAIVQSVRGYGFATIKHRRRIGLPAAVSDAFLNAVAVALDASEAFANAAGVTGAQLRDAIAYTNAYRPVANELELMASGIAQGVWTTRAEAAGLALKAYRLSKGFNSPSGPELFVPHIANMKKALGRGRPKTIEPQPDSEGEAEKKGGPNA